MSTEKSEAKRVEELLVKLKEWAAEREIPPDAVVAAFGGIEQPLPPNHTTVTWFDIHRPDGGKIHVVVRGGATRGEVLDTVSTASNAFGDLVEEGWMPADRKPRTEAEITETTARVEEKLKKPSGDGEEDERSFAVDSITKLVTDKGNTYYQVKGFPWREWGAKAWPDSSGIGKLAGRINFDAWEVGKTVEFEHEDIHAVVTQKMGGKGKMIPVRVIDFVGVDVLDEAPEGYDARS